MDGSDEEGSDDDAEEEIWKAITASKPEVEGADEDDDISMADLESAYSDSEEGSEAGIDLGGDGEDDGQSDEEIMLEGDPGAEEMDEMPEFEDGDEAVFDDEDEFARGLRAGKCRRRA